MRKFQLPLIFLIVAILFSLSLLLGIFNNGSLISKDFLLRKQWSTDLGEEVQGLSTNGDKIIFARTSQGLSALDIQSGKILWRHDLARQASSEPAIEDKGVVFIADSKSIWAIDQATGTVLWKAPAPMPVSKVRSVSQNVVAVEGGTYIYVYNVANGSLLWSGPACRYGGVLAYADNSQVYVPCLGRILAMNGSTGETEWETEAKFSIAKVAYQNGVMYYSPLRDSISAYDLRNRKEIWKTYFHGEGYRQFKILGDLIYIIGSDKICTLQVTTGDQLGCIDHKNLQNPTSIEKQLFVFNGYHNHISAFDLSSGQKLGDLTIRNMKLFMIQRELMLSLNSILVFGSDSRVFGYGL